MNAVLMLVVHELKVLMTTLLQLLTLFMFCQVSPTKEESGIVQWSTSFSSALMVNDIANVLHTVNTHNTTVFGNIIDRPRMCVCV